VDEPQGAQGLDEVQLAPVEVTEVLVAREHVGELALQQAPQVPSSLVDALFPDAQEFLTRG
jgi:hypothetical protein